MKRIYNIYAHNSSVVVGNTGNVQIGNSSDIEQELIKVFRALPLRDKVNLMNTAYQLQDKLKPQPVYEQ